MLTEVKIQDAEVIYGKIVKYSGKFHSLNFYRMFYIFQLIPSPSYISIVFLLFRITSELVKVLWKYA